MIDELLSSGILENEELGTTLLRSTEVSDEQKRKYIDKFVEDYISGKSSFKDKENLLQNWAELYLPTVKDAIKKRVKKIE